MCNHGMTFVLLLCECRRFGHFQSSNCVTQGQLVYSTQPGLGRPLGDDMVVVLELTVHNLCWILFLIGFKVQVVFARVHFK